ncbi:methionyl-tRNA formyltransferase [Thioclava sp. ES.031]|uniref:methionyl-tRNA formyltransferase n=1 Tax=unclassified Thioclava TaxID=2621713 RepID=UPI000997D137|nr:MULTISPECIES: methionyl-tRNA formyltransferase [unclassified Thioclava]OOY09273.1 methionyl-tRNA formyltransferase [Thioclava sp. F36-7]PFG61736.1 methionyl-tRNA formyltransferase [Thioclava sp. ES.031]
MRVIFMGTPEFSVPVLEALAGAHEVVAVYSQPPRPAGRGKKERPSPVHAKAEELGIEVRTPRNFKAPEDRDAFAALNADIAVVVAYGLILPQAILDAPAKGCLNIHASLLPRWRGAAPIHRAIMAGDSQTGICIMQMEAGLDTGPVLLREATEIGATETTGELHDRLSAMGARLILDALSEIDSLILQPQPEDGVTYAAKIDKAEAQVDWTRPADEVIRHINGLSPFPGAWTEIAGERIKLLRAAPAEGSGAPGEILDGFTIACGTGALEILEAQRPGKRPMSGADVLRGLRLPARLG